MNEVKKSGKNKFWQVNNISKDAIAVIKGRAKNRGLSMGQYLDWHFTKDVDSVGHDSSKTEREYRITMDVQAMNKLRRLAANSGYGVAKYLEVIANG